MYSLVSKWFFLIIFLDISIICVLGFRFPRLGIISQNTKMQYHDNSIINISYYTQRLDHFNYKPESSITFKQRYVIDFKNWGGSKSGAPIFVWFNGETSLEDGIDAAGILKDNALRFKALLLYIEHRYYGKSFPFGSSEEALKNASTMGYLNSAQALADYAAILLDIRKTLNAHDSPIIVYGGSYGGLLAAWFRLKYPHIAYGALASSAPILYFDGVAPKHGYYYIVSKDFRSMFQPRPFNMENYLDSCEQQYSVIPLPHWIITYYGGQDIKLVFKRFASNIIFSNGLKYPYSSGGVLESLSPSLIALTTVNGTHCLDILPAQQNDPKWLINQRHVEINIIASWIAEYQADRLIC
ncbi:lysosomal Pro-X carboxypeptidase-like [Arachis ipaensis]|uniref:lysosomal Pro-X carboxypeptidase-like n=1 Tax=Arachis ipaensis TaxID=130454 RepID=UPI000A2B95AF|nr:lysosomal Pro-X carboxypeptidase-like [Arachis ipaensis]